MTAHSSPGAGTRSPCASPGRSETEGAARVQAILKVRLGVGSQPILYMLSAHAQDVALPAGVPKDVKIWVPVLGEGAYVVALQVLSQGGQVLAEESANAQAGRADAPLVATVADSSTLAAQLAKVEVPLQQGLAVQVRAVELQSARDVPARAEYLTPFRAIAVQGNAAATLTIEQRRAVQDWVVQGGHLLIVGGPDGPRAASVLGTTPPMCHGRALPVSMAQSISSHLRNGRLARAATPSSAVLPASRPAPRNRWPGGGDALVARSTWGEGSVTLLGPDPTLEPLRGWPSTTALLKRALEPAFTGVRSVEGSSRTPTELTARVDDFRLIAALDALPPEVFPDWQRVGLLLGGFALIAGPVARTPVARGSPTLAVGRGPRIGGGFHRRDLPVFWRHSRSRRGGQCS